MSEFIDKKFILLKVDYSESKEISFLELAKTLKTEVLKDSYIIIPSERLSPVRFELLRGILGSVCRKCNFKFVKIENKPIPN